MGRFCCSSRSPGESDAAAISLMRGYLLILSGYILWGLFPLYWGLLNHVPALEVLLHRIIWALPVLLLLVIFSARRCRQVKAALQSRSEMGLLFLSSLAICCNWGIYVWAVANQRVVEASMGYFLTPLLNVVAGVVIFRESIDKLKALAVVFAALGVFYYIASTAAIPWVGLSVGITVAGYGLLRKKMPSNAVPGLFVEVLILLPPALLLMLWLHLQGEAVFLNHSGKTNTWLILSGLVTVIPLALFTAGSRLLPMTTVGLLFYITPTLQFLSGVFLLNEAFSHDLLIGFISIWFGLTLFSVSLIRFRSTR